VNDLTLFGTAKWGTKSIILVGFILADIGAVLFYLTLSGEDKFALYWLGMGFVGIGWNFSFIGGTTLLSGEHNFNYIWVS